MAIISETNDQVSAFEPCWSYRQPIISTPALDLRIETSKRYYFYKKKF
jgi:hypothetical protein